LIDIHQILQVAHTCQELLSAERCPTLALALQVYEKLVVHWTALTEVLPELAHYIRLGIGKIMEYVAMGRRSRIYALAMSKIHKLDPNSFNRLFLVVLNPKTKFKWMEQHWSPEEVRDAEVWMEEAVRADVSIYIRLSDRLTDAGTSDSTKKIRPGNTLNIVPCPSS
jgi:hypothetical protein